MDESSKLLLTITIPTVTVLIGILVNNRQLDSLRRELLAEIGGKFAVLSSRLDSLDLRIDSLEKLIDAKFEALNQAIRRVEQVMDARLRHLEER